MGAELLLDSEVAELCDRCSSAADIDLRRLLTTADDDELRLTQNAQPALCFVGLGLTVLLRRRGIEPVAAAGHSVGEYTALVASGGLPWQEALKLVRERGMAMAEASSEAQGMSAVLGLDAAAVEAAIDGVPGTVVVANHNAPGQLVISGERVSIVAAGERLKAAGAKRVIPLTVAGAFHSPLMAAASERLGAALDRAPLVDGRPQAFNVDGAIRTAADQVRGALRAQLTSAVHWTDCVRSLLELGVDRFLELGSGTTLTAMGKRIAPAAGWASMARPEALVGP